MIKNQPTKRIEKVFEEIAKEVDSIELSKFKRYGDEEVFSYYILLLFGECSTPYEKRFLKPYFSEKQIEIIQNKFDVLFEIGDRLKNTYIMIESGFFVYRDSDMVDGFN